VFLVSQHIVSLYKEKRVGGRRYQTRSSLKSRDVTDCRVPHLTKQQIIFY
jgi:hypothetical protein